ncbi:MAG: Co2+/Mg2+ efflux protein ApaG [Planctomycetota bacterium]
MNDESSGDQRRTGDPGKRGETSHRETEGIAVTVSAQFLAEESSPSDDHYFFSYEVLIRNDGSAPAQLVSRHWIIINSAGDRHEVRGQGVVGETPRLEPGQEFRYTSYCPLDTHWGTMEGSFRMQRDDGEVFDAEVGRFLLIADRSESVVRL